MDKDTLGKQETPYWVRVAVGSTTLWLDPEVGLSEVATQGLTYG